MVVGRHSHGQSYTSGTVFVTQPWAPTAGAAWWSEGSTMTPLLRHASSQEWDRVSTPDGARICAMRV